MEKKTMDWRWEVLPCVILVFLWAYLISAYPDLPERVVTHINGAGQADGFAAKSFFSVGGVLLISTGLYAMILLLNRLLVGRAKDFRKYVNIPNKDKIPEEKLEDIRLLVMRYLYGINVFVLVLLGYLQVEVIRMSYGYAMGAPWIVWAAIVLPTFGTVYFLAKFNAATDKKP